MNKYSRSSNLSSAEALSAFDAPRHRADIDTMPSDLDPNRNPIVAEHFFGWRRLGDVKARLNFRKNGATAEEIGFLLGQPGMRSSETSPNRISMTEGACNGEHPFCDPG